MRKLIIGGDYIKVEYEKYFDTVDMYRNLVKEADIEGNHCRNRYMTQHYLLASLKKDEVLCQFPTKELMEAQMYVNEELEKTDEILYKQFGIRINLD